MVILKYSVILLHVAIVLVQAAELTKKPETAIEADTVPIKEIANDGAAAPADVPGKTTVPPTTTTTTTTTLSPPTVTPVPTTAPPIITTTTSSPSTTSAPPALDYWVVKDKDVVCILAKMDIKLDLNFNHSKDYPMTVPKNAAANGTCGKNEQNLQLSWYNNTIKMNFKANDTINKYYIDYVELNVTTADNKSMVLSKPEIIMFETALNHSYLCSYSDPLKVSQNNNSAQVSFSNIKLEAFKKDNSTKFSTISACPPDTPDIVPIVVGCALTILVITVLIAYLVSRRRTQARGYLSM